jgi:hypothetical protein
VLKKYIAYWGLSAHVIWIVALCIDPVAMHATPLSTLAECVNYSPVALVFGLATSALATLAAMSPASRVGYRTIALLIPQQFFMLIAAGGSIVAIYNGHYADGVQRTSAFILADQSPWILAALLYTASICEHFGRRAWTPTG